LGAHSKDGRASILFKRLEHTEHGIIHEDNDDDEKVA
jgi:hypothetical protein